MNKIAPFLAVLACAPLSAAQAQNVRQVSLTTNDIIYDAHTAKIYASVPSSVGAGGNSITPIDPVAGTVGPSVFVGSEPNRLAVSDDGSTLYVALDGTSSIRRFDTAAQTTGVVFSYGFGAIKDMQVAPAAPSTLVVALGSGSGHDGNAGVVIFQNGVAEADPPFQNSIYELDSLVFGSSTRLYGYDNYSSGFEFARLTLGSSSLSVQDHLDNLASGFGTTIQYDNGLIYASSGSVFDPETEVVAGQFLVPTIPGPSPQDAPAQTQSFWSHSGDGRIYFLLGDPNGRATTATLAAYDRNTYLCVGILTVPNVSGKVSRLIGWGSHGLAFRAAGGQVFFVDTNGFVSLASVTVDKAAVAAGASLTGTATLTHPAQAGGVTVSLASDFFVDTVPTTVTIPAGQTSAAFPITTKQVSYSASVSVTATLGTQTEQTAFLLQGASDRAAYPGNVRVLTLPTSDLVYDPGTARIYASIPSRAGVIGNSLLPVDPLLASAGIPVPIGSEPNRLARSDDGQYLYAGLDGAGAVRRYDLGMGMATLQFTLGNDTNSYLGAGPYTAEDLHVPPGQPTAVAVSRRNVDISPTNAGIAIYDNGAMRPQSVLRDRFTYNDRIAFSTSGARLYGTSLQSSDCNLSRFNVGGSGVTLQDQSSHVLSGYLTDTKFDAGRIYASNGQVVDPETETVVGTFPGVNSDSGSFFNLPPTLVAADVAHGRVFFLQASLVGQTLVESLLAYDTNTYLLIGSQPIPGIVGTPSSLTRWGSDGLAFRTSSDQLFLVRTPLSASSSSAGVSSLALAPASVLGGAQATATVVLNGPAPAGGLTVWLGSSDAAHVLIPATLLIPAGATTGTFPISTSPVMVYSPVLISATANGMATSQLIIRQPTHAHALWNNSDGRVMLWSIAPDGSFTLNGFGPYTDGAPQNVWYATAVATGADGLSHLLWNNTDGRVMLWTVDDSGNFSLAGYGPYTDGAANNKWSATAVSVGPDNTVHLLWNNTDHRVMLWNVDSSFNFSLAGYGPYTDTSVSSDPGNLWSATALATGPDNKSRIAWNNTDGRVMLWDVDSAFGFTLAGYGPYTDNAPQNKWSAVGVSVGPDDVTHLLWSNTDHRAMFWNVAPDFTFTLAGYGPYTDSGANNLWSAIGVATGPDGLSHLLWNNTDNRAMLWGVDSAFNFTVAGYGPYTDNGPGNLWSATAVSAGP